MSRVRISCAVLILLSLALFQQVFGCPQDDDLQRQILGEKVLLGSQVRRIKRYLPNSGLFEQENDAAFSKLREISVRANSLHLSQSEHLNEYKSILASLIQFEEYLEATHGQRYRGVIKASANALLNNCPVCTYCYIFDNYPDSKSYLVNNASCDFLNELLGEGRAANVTTFITSYNYFNYTAVTNSMKDDFLLEMLQILTLQTIDNPTYYVSHGTDHSVRVMGWQYILRDLVDVYMANLYGCTLDSASPIELNSTCTFVLMLNGILHDTGYIDIANNPNVAKFVHAVSGSVMDSNLFAQENDLGFQVLNATASKGDISAAYLYAIKTHNNDDQDCLWKTGPNYNSSCTSPSTPILRQAGYPAIVPRNYTEPHAELDPMSFLIRVSDNFDSARSRLTEEQTSEDFMRYLCWLYTDQDLRIAKNSKSAQPAARERAIKAAQAVNPSWDPTPIMGMINRTDLQSFLFFYSVWMVDDLTLTYDKTFTHFTLTVAIHDTPFNACEHCNLAFQNHPGPALYQINRLAISMHSLFILNASFLESITVELTQSVPGLEGTRFPLKAFTQKEVYNSSGPIEDEYICGDCTYSLELTNSPEDCSTSDGSIVECVDITELGSPYADLSFDTSLRPSKDGCNPNHDEKHPWWFWVLVIAVPVVALLLIIGLVVFIIRRRRSGYTAINSPRG